MNAPDNEPVVLLPTPPPNIEPEALLAWITDRTKWEERFCQLMTRNPLEALGVLLLGGSFLFYLAEVNRNHKVKTFWDALYYITTCASVGYADVFATTPAGKAISAVVFTFGPALTSQVFDRPPAGSPDGRATDDYAVVERLDAILAEMRKQNNATQQP
jgi:hypothetical protein